MRPFRQHKYKAKRTGGFASKREAEYASWLDAQKCAGQILDYLTQVPIHLPGCKYVVDFAVVANDGTVSFVEVKGVFTEAAKVKIRLLEATRPELFARLTVVR